MVKKELEYSNKLILQQTNIISIIALHSLTRTGKVYILNSQLLALTALLL